MATPFGNQVPQQGNFEVPNYGEGEILKFIIYDMDHPKSYLDTLEKDNQKKKEAVEAMGKEFTTPRIPAFKESGIACKAMVIARTRGLNTFEEVFKGTDSVPGYSVQLFMPPPEKIFYSRFFGYEKGVDPESGTDKHGEPKISTMLPSPVEFRVDAPEIAWKDRLVPSKMTDTEKKQYSTVVQKEEERLSIWKNVMDYYNAQDEQGAINILRIMFAQKFCLVNRDVKGDYQLVLPHIGTIFTCGVKVDKYVELVPFYWDRILKKNIFQTKWTVERDDASIELASNIRKLLTDGAVPF